MNISKVCLSLGWRPYPAGPVRASPLVWASGVSPWEDGRGLWGHGPATICLSRVGSVPVQCRPCPAATRFEPITVGLSQAAGQCSRSNHGAASRWGLSQAGRPAPRAQGKGTGERPPQPPRSRALQAISRATFQDAADAADQRPRLLGCSPRGQAEVPIQAA